MNGHYFGPCTTIRQYRDRDQSIQDEHDAELEAARQEADEPAVFYEPTLEYYAFRVAQAKKKARKKKV